MHPAGIVVRFHDHPLRADDAAGVLPGAGLAEDVEAADVPAHQRTLAVFVRNAVHRRHVALGRGGELGDELDIPFLFDGMLDHPRRVLVGLEHHRERAFGGHETVARRRVSLARHIFPLDAPGVGRDAAALQEADRALLRVEVFPRGSVGPVGDGPGDRVQAEMLETRLVGHAPHVLVQEVRHQVVGGDRQPVGDAAFERGHQTLLRCHCHRWLPSHGAANRVCLAAIVVQIIFRTRGFSRSGSFLEDRLKPLLQCAQSPNLYLTNC